VLKPRDQVSAARIDLDQPFRFRLEPAPEKRAVKDVGMLADEADVVHI
jgi:hypothetical protein